MTTYHELWLNKVGNYCLVSAIKAFEEYGLGDFIIERMVESKNHNEITLISDLYEYTLENRLIEDFIETYERRGGKYIKIVVRNERIYKFKVEWLKE